jgi:Tfp pilus assembly protein PilF
VSNRRRLAVVGGLLVFALAASVLLAASLGARLPGQTVTGNSASGGADTQDATFRRAVQRRPDDPQTHLAYARFLLGSSKPAAALKEYDATTRLDPKNAEAYAYGGWIVYLAGLPDDALKRLDAAVAADPAYSDAHFFRGMVLFQGKNDACHAKPELQQYLAVGNQTSLRPQVEQVLAAAVKACPN